MTKVFELEKRICIMFNIMTSNISSLPVRNFDVALARAFLATVETGGMTAAARFLNLTQGAISQQIKRLEDVLGRRLFDRNGRDLELTPDGERLLTQARRLVALNDEIWGVMTMPDFEGEVRLGVPRDIIRPYVPPILRAFSDAWPKVQTHLICKTSPSLKDALDAGEIDLALTTELTTPRGAERLLTDDLVWMGAPNGKAMQAQPLPIAVTSETCTFRAAMVEAVERNGRDWRSVGPVGNNDALFATIEADLAVSALLRATIPSHIPVLEASETVPELPPFHINLYVRNAQSNDVARELADHIREQFARRFVSRAGIDKRAS